MAVRTKSDHLNRMVTSPFPAILDVVDLKNGFTVLVHIIGLPSAQRVLAMTTAPNQHGPDGSRGSHRLLPNTTRRTVVVTPSFSSLNRRTKTPIDLKRTRNPRRRSDSTFHLPQPDGRQQRPRHTSVKESPTE